LDIIITHYKGGSMKKKRIILLLLGIIICFMVSVSFAQQQEKTKADGVKSGLELQPKTILVDRGYTEDAKKCIECHSQKTPGIIENWKNGKMGHASISCYDCHVVEKDSPMASQCEGVRGTDIYTSPMVSAATCARCHPREEEQFQKSAHAELAYKIINDTDRTKYLMYVLEGQQALGVKPGSKTNMVPRNSCQMCHGANVEVGADNKPINMTWPGGVSTKYPDGAIGNCTVCHTRHEFSVAEARKPEACASCHRGPDHNQIEIYEGSKHGQVYNAHGEEWNFEAAPDTWEPGDYDAPTCAVCHMSGIGELSSTHNVNERLKWNLHAPRSDVRSGERGDGVRGEKLMRQVCSSCHSSLHTNVQREVLDETVTLYNVYWDRAVEMEKELAEKNLLGEDNFSDGFQELKLYLTMFTGRRARQGPAMNGMDSSQLVGLYQMMKVLKDLEAIYNYRIKNNKIEDLSHVMNGGDM
jgi:hypothetical protein